MTVLPSKQIRDDLNIRCHEQALTFAALLLISANKASENTGINDALRTSVKLTTANSQSGNTITSNILIEGKFFYSRTEAFNSGGVFVDYVLPFSSFDPGDWLGDACDPIDSDLGFDPVFVTSLEHFFCFHALQWQRALILANSMEVFTRCKISILDEGSPSQYLAINALIPYSYEKYTETRSLLRSVEKLVPSVSTLNITQTFDTQLNLALSGINETVETKIFNTQSNLTLSGISNDQEIFREINTIANLTLSGNSQITPITFYENNAMLILSLTSEITEFRLQQGLGNLLLSGTSEDKETYRINNNIGNLSLSGVSENILIVGEIYSDLNLSQYQVVATNGIETYSDLDVLIYQP